MILGNRPFVVGLSLINFCPMFPFYNPCILQFLKNILLELNTSITIFYSKNQNRVHWGIKLPQKHPPPLFRQAPPPHSENCPSPPCLVNSPCPYRLVFREPPLDFSVNPHNIEIFHP